MERKLNLEEVGVLKKEEEYKKLCLPLNQRNNIWIRFILCHSSGEMEKEIRLFNYALM